MRMCGGDGTNYHHAKPNNEASCHLEKPLSRVPSVGPWDFLVGLVFYSPIIVFLRIEATQHDCIVREQI